MSSDSESADVFDFVDAYLADLERGQDRPLAYWLERFPSSPDAIAREWLALRQPASSANQLAPSNGVSSGEARDRIGPYRILSELGRGGQGTVFLAEDTRIARRVALKVLTSRFDSISDEKRQRFKREADVIARLEHPGLCSIHDADLMGEAPWIAMRFVEGRTLGECLVEAREKGGAEVFGLRLPPQTIVEIHAVLSFFERAARALHAAHEAGVVHRDVKPGNIIVALDGRPVLLDFGLARDETSETGTLTQSGDVFGTPAYMSPEQLSLPSSELDRRADEYSLGVALYEALTLERPFEHTAKSALYRAIYSDPPPDPRQKNKALSEDIKVVLETTLEKERARRYGTTFELAEDLRRIREYEPIRARPASMGVKLSRWMHRHPALAVAIPGTILTLSIGLIVTLKLLDKADEALSWALGKHLAQRAVALSVEDPPSGVVLGIEGVERAPNELTRSSLFTALESCWLVAMVGSQEPKRRVADVAASPVADLSAVAFTDGAILVVSATDGTTVAEIESMTPPIVEIELDARGRLLVAGESGALRIHDARTGARLAAASHPGPITCAQWAADGASILVAGKTLGVAILDTASLALIRSVAPPAALYESAHFSADGTAILALKPGATAAVFDARDGRRIFEITTGGGVLDAQFVDTSTASRILVAGVDGIVHVVDARDGTETGPTMKLPAPPTSIHACAGIPRAVVLSRTGEDGAAFLVDVERGTSIALGPTHGRRPTAAAFSPDRKRVATTSYDTSVKTWDASTGELLRAFIGPRRQFDVAWSADGERLISHPDGASAQIWYSRVRPDVFELEGHTATVNSVAFARDGKTALTASADGTARLWHVDPGVGLKLSVEYARFVHDGPVRCAAFSESGDVVMTTGTDNAVRTWEPQTGNALREFARHPSAVLAAALDPRGERFVTLCGDGRARVWQSRSDAEPLVLPMEFVLGSAAAFSPDGRVIAIGDTRDAVQIFDSGDGHLVRTISFAQKDAQCGGTVTLAFRPAHDEIAVGCGDQRLRWFSTSDGETTLAESKMFSFGRISFSRDGRRALLSGAWGSGAVRSLSLEDGKTQFPRSSHTDDMTSACYSDDAALVLTTSEDGSARVWRTQDGSPEVRREGFGVAVTCGALSNALGMERALIGCANGRVCVWPIDPLPAALARNLPPLNPGTRDRERTLALPLEYR